MRCEFKRLTSIALALMLFLTVTPALAAGEPGISARARTAYEIYRQGMTKYIVGQASATPIRLALVLRDVHTGAGYTVQARDANGAALSFTATAATGQLIVSKDKTGKEADRATLVLFGDVTGNGTVGLADVVLTLHAFQNKVSLSGAKQLAADRNRNGKIEMTDVVSVTRVMQSSSPAVQPSTARLEVHANADSYTDSRAVVTVQQTAGDAVSAVTVAVWPVGDAASEKIFKAERTGSLWRARFTWAGYFDEPGTYCIEARSANAAGTSSSAGRITVQVAQSGLEGTQIMGKSACTVAQLVNIQLGSYGWDDTWYGGMTAAQFCQMYYDICEKEGVRAEVAYAQMIHETGGLRYGGLVSREQYNYAGLGATGATVQSDKWHANHRYTEEGKDAGLVFATVENGIKSHVQHLKGYASKDALVLEKAPEYDRYGAGGIGTAPLVEQLGQTWTESTEYGPIVLDLMDRILAQSAIMSIHIDTMPTSRLWISPDRASNEKI